MLYVTELQESVITSVIMGYVLCSIRTDLFSHWRIEMALFLLGVIVGAVVIMAIVVIREDMK